MARDLIGVVRDLLATQRSQPVIDLGRVRRLVHALERLQQETGIDHVLALFEGASAEIVSWYESVMLDQVERVVDDHRGAALPSLVRQVTGDPAFQRLNREIRKTRAMFGDDIPAVYVPSHFRAGVRVRGHHRLVGYEHLAGIPVANRAPVVNAIIRLLLASNTDFRTRP